ncbi:PREDICTED: probable E3 ubiquitin-protein ligase HERC4 [Pygoscelis adeliae]|nr:PREDICTED: probable E3 ubiquitin-protein ligase HERC4 [Pygoscelis adeliae]
MSVHICSAELTQSQKNEKVQCSNHDGTHMLILSPDGKLFEQWATASADCSKPRLVKELGNQDIVQIACGDQHTMALSRGGELFSWGQNAHGQLGVGSQTTLIPQPQLVERLKGISLAQIAAGGAHSTAVSLSGAVYSWGKNDFGQLGLGDTEDRDCPSYVGALEHWKTVFISCGADHTAVLSKEGLVCTFGAGGAGQLGHNSTRNELVPRVVAELWGARVSQVACGRQHTLVYVPSLDKVYSFGSGKEGQLGDERKPNQLIPLPINSPVNTGKSCQGNNTSQKVIEIIAGGNRSIVLCKNKNSYLNGIATLTDKEVDAWISNSSSQHWESIKKNIRLIFSSEACINGSFLEKRDKHFKTSKEFSGVDMSEVQRFYKKISKKPQVFQEVQKEIQKLLPSLSSSPISPENFRVYLILPFLLQGYDGSSFHSLRLLAQAITKLQPKDLQILECLWSNLETSFFKELVVLYKTVSEKSLSQFIMEVSCLQRNPYNLHPHETEPLQILQILYQVNSRTGFRVQENDFCVRQVKGIVRLLLFFDVEVSIKSYQQCKTPFFLFYLNESIYMKVNSRLYCKRKSTHLFLSSLSFQMALWKLTEYPCIFDMHDKIGIHSIECSALSRSFNYVSVANFASSCKNTFFQIGTLCGMALYNRCMAPFPFPRALYKKLLGLAPALEDLEELLPAAGRSLRRILDEECDHVLESLDMDFTIMEEGGSMVPVDLKKNGANIPVTKDNRKEFVDLYVNYVFNESIRKPFEDFMQGFLRGCPARKWKMFLPVELQTVLEGHTKIDWHLLEKNVTYRHYGMLDQTIRNFWTVFHKLPEEKKKMFLAFLSGSDRIPGCGLEYFKFSIVDPQVENPDEVYPSASTCSRILFLPRYSSKRILKKKLLYATEHNENFGLP